MADIDLLNSLANEIGTLVINTHIKSQELLTVQKQIASLQVQLETEVNQKQAILAELDSVKQQLKQLNLENMNNW